MARTSVLVVEDEQVVALDICRKLASLGYQAYEPVATGEGALEAVRTMQPDLVLMDILLSGEMDGIDAARQIRAYCDLPVIYLSSLSGNTVLERAMITEPYGYLTKPVEQRELHMCLEIALYKHKMEQRLKASEGLLDATLRSLGDAVVTTDETGLIRYVNPAAELLLGRRSRKMVGQDLNTVGAALSSCNGCGVADLLGHVLSGRGAMVPEDTWEVLEGRSAIPVDVTMTPVRTDTGKVNGAVLVMRDITRKKATERALLQTVTELRDTVEEAVTALTITSEKRDPYTAGHQQRVAHLAEAIGTRMGLSSERLGGIRVSALLHDIGKIYIPAEILTKPCALSPLEMGIMQAHSEVGFDILKSVTFPWPVADIVLQHHERLDGSGYPNGTGGGDVMLEARILAVADVVEAMSSHRPYRAALGVESALAEIVQYKNSLFDPLVVDCCYDLLRGGEFSFQ